LEEQPVEHIDEVYAMEQDVLRMLDAMISTTDDAEVRGEHQHHRQDLLVGVHEARRRSRWCRRGPAGARPKHR
jgi:hypothetical protein